MEGVGARNPLAGDRRGEDPEGRQDLVSVSIKLLDISGNPKGLRRRTNGVGLTGDRVDKASDRGYNVTTLLRRGAEAIVEGKEVI